MELMRHLLIWKRSRSELCSLFVWVWAGMDGHPVWPAGGGLDWAAPEEPRSRESSQDGRREETQSSADVSLAEWHTELQHGCQHDRGPMKEGERRHNAQLLPANVSLSSQFQLDSINFISIRVKRSLPHFKIRHQQFCTESYFPLKSSSVSRSFSSSTVEDLLSFFLSLFLSFFPLFFCLVFSFLRVFASFFVFIIL